MVAVVAGARHEQQAVPEWPVEAEEAAYRHLMLFQLSAEVEVVDPLDVLPQKIRMHRSKASNKQ